VVGRELLGWVIVRVRMTTTILSGDDLEPLGMEWYGVGDGSGVAPASHSEYPLPVLYAKYS